jgi:hypothetical protein
VSLPLAKGSRRQDAATAKARARCPAGSSATGCLEPGNKRQREAYRAGEQNRDGTPIDGVDEPTAAEGECSAFNADRARAQNHRQGGEWPGTPPARCKFDANLGGLPQLNNAFDAYPPANGQSRCYGHHKRSRHGNGGALHASTHLGALERARCIVRGASGGLAQYFISAIDCLKTLHREFITGMEIRVVHFGQLAKGTLISVPSASCATPSTLYKLTMHNLPSHRLVSRNKRRVAVSRSGLTGRITFLFVETAGLRDRSRSNFHKIAVFKPPPNAT